MEAKAEARYIRVSPQKARLVVDLIRGKSADQARITLRSTNKRIAPTVGKVLDSAIANAKERFEDVDVDRLVVSSAYVNEGPRGFSPEAHATTPGVNPDPTQFHFETDPQRWAAGGSPITGIATSTAQHFAGRQSLAD